jgi:type II secretory pathway predicted ATPase ExeA
MEAMNMYKQYFGLKTDPFSKEIDENHLFESKGMREVASRLDFHLQTRGFFLLTADAGVGKTTALRRFASSLNPGIHRVCYIAMTSLTVMDFYRSLIIRMGASPEYGKVMMFEQIQNLVSESYYSKRVTPVFIVDEAQCLVSGILDDLKMIFNFKMDSENPFVFVMSGNHTIRRKLQLSAHQSLRQRFVGNYHMEGLGEGEVAAYIAARLRLAGAPDENIFEPTATEAIQTATNGCPRLVNNFADASLKLAAVLGKKRVDEGIVYQASKDIEI